MNANNRNREDFEDHYEMVQEQINRLMQDCDVPYDMMQTILKNVENQICWENRPNFVSELGVEYRDEPVWPASIGQRRQNKCGKRAKEVWMALYQNPKGERRLTDKKGGYADDMSIFSRTLRDTDDFEAVFKVILFMSYRTTYRGYRVDFSYSIVGTFMEPGRHGIKERLETETFDSVEAFVDWYDRVYGEWEARNQKKQDTLDLAEEFGINL